VLTYAQKQETVAELKDKFARAKSVFVADYRGLDVESINELRTRLRSEGQGEYEYHVTKNTLLKLAAEGSDVAALTEHFQGPTAIALSYGDPVGLAKALVGYAKEHEAFELRGGLLDGKAIGTGEIATLATLPGLDGLRGMLVGLLQAPAQKIAAILAAPAGQLARVIEARRAQQEESGGA
jgi:large subunit ribosomal protein L10